MTGMETPWQLFRFHQADGRDKDWAYRRLSDGSVEIAWGRSGRVSQRRAYPAIQARVIENRALEKQRKGYVSLGPAVLDRYRFDVLSAQQASVGFDPDPALITQLRIDLSGIAPGQENLWF